MWSVAVGMCECEQSAWHYWVSWHILTEPTSCGDRQVMWTYLGRWVNLSILLRQEAFLIQIPSCGQPICSGPFNCWSFWMFAVNGTMLYSYVGCRRPFLITCQVIPLGGGWRSLCLYSYVSLIGSTYLCNTIILLYFWIFVFFLFVKSWMLSGYCMKHWTVCYQNLCNVLQFQKLHRLMMMLKIKMCTLHRSHFTFSWAQKTSFSYYCSLNHSLGWIEMLWAIKK